VKSVFEQEDRHEEWSSQASVDTVPTPPCGDLELIWADSAEMAVTTDSIVEGIDVVRDVFVRKIAVLVDVFLDPFLLQAPEEGLGDRVDAPMSSRAHRLPQVGQDQRVQLPNNVALEAAVDFFLCQTLARTPGNVFTRARIAAHSNHGDGP